ncbi:hypothetical protein [Acetobacterium tundrae]|uniref:Uncharacterized protein n=1 Tax=Acetobacterium tundrae TaxID=132932 RepID=A0ABR6WPU8_9FIRM|nr:hypothetical protein [Acetobacterium tundrae]MBC3798513.1 hypothetical protein [Acetobacterium tundrae]
MEITTSKKSTIGLFHSMPIRLGDQDNLLSIVSVITGYNIDSVKIKAQNILLEKKSQTLP